MVTCILSTTKETKFNKTPLPLNWGFGSRRTFLKKNKKNTIMASLKMEFHQKSRIPSMAGDYCYYYNIRFVGINNFGEELRTGYYPGYASAKTAKEAKAKIKQQYMDSGKFDRVLDCRTNSEANNFLMTGE